MSRRIRVNLTRWVCRTVGHDMHGWKTLSWCDRCGRVW